MSGVARERVEAPEAAGQVEARVVERRDGVEQAPPGRGQRLEAAHEEPEPEQDSAPAPSAITVNSATRTDERADTRRGRARRSTPGRAADRSAGCGVRPAGTAGSVEPVMKPKPPIWIISEDRDLAEGAPVGRRVDDDEAGDADRRGGGEQRVERARSRCPSPTRSGASGSASRSAIRTANPSDEDDRGRRRPAGPPRAVEREVAGPGQRATSGQARCAAAATAWGRVAHARAR